MNWYKNYFFKSKRFFLLRTTGWLIGLAVCLLLVLFGLKFLAPMAGLLTSIMVDIYLFKIKKLKESSFKDPEIFDKTCEILSEQFDKFASVITWAKPIALALVVAFGIYIAEDYQDLLGNILVAPIFYAPFIVCIVAPKIAIWFKIADPEVIHRRGKGWHYGVPGFNSEGTYTGSSTAVGGCSS